MPPKILNDKEIADITRHLMNQGVGELRTKGLTEQEETERMGKTFKEIKELGYSHIHTLKVIPEDGRKPYFVHIDSVTKS